MKKKLLCFVLLSVATFSLSSNATIIFTVDTGTELQGTFSATGTANEARNPIQFAGLLPGDSTQQRFFVKVFPGGPALVGALAFGSPDSPNIDMNLSGSPVSDSVSGSYSNDPLAQVVDFSLSVSHDTGSTDGGTFSGSFSFKVRATPPASVPEGGATAALLAMSFAGLAIVRKRMVWESR
ncbi:MAG: hypothetical protein U1G07_08870 [Verrucomicrobiota bacterium]